MTLIVIATAIGGVAGYVITWLVPRAIGFADYAVYAIFWSFLFLVISGLSGIQQEVTRATRRITSPRKTRIGRAPLLGALSAALVFLLVIVTAPLWVQRAFPLHGWDLVWPLAVGTASYVLVAVTAGSLYGITAWMPVFWLVVVDAMLRLIGLLVILMFTGDIVILAWAVVIPFPATLLILVQVLRRKLVRRTELDVRFGQLLWNAGRTVVAAAATGVMVSGFPLLLGLTSPSASNEDLGLLILAITLTRAPLIVAAMALQSFLIVFFREKLKAFWARLLRVQGLILMAGVVLAGLGWWAGPAVFSFLFPGELVPEGWLVAVLVLSSGLVSALCVTGAALLALAQHAAYSLGWVTAAVVTVVSLILPFDLTTRSVLSLLAGPVAGLLAHWMYLIATRAQPLPGDQERAGVLPGL